MDNITEFHNRRANVLDLGNGLVLGRESVKGMDFMTITQGDEILFAWWHNPKRKPTDKPPKHTGGKPSYVKLLIKEMQNHDLSLEAAGLIQKVIPNINWGDNLLIDVRSKKPLNVDGLCKILKKSKPFVIKILNELKETNLIIKDKEGYKVSPNLIQKGGAKR